MTKDVLITISGIQMIDEEDSDRINSSNSFFFSSAFAFWFCC